MRENLGSSGHVKAFFSFLEFQFFLQLSGTPERKRVRIFDISHGHLDFRRNLLSTIFSLLLLYIWSKDEGSS